ncbi:MAG: 50S ribosomal protein L29 [Puniceicoccales bacterium]|jgi:large subunit ribosomal protein L29|nr:50S ribosomal protein L29 [Puniceicoccales bacterium]
MEIRALSDNALDEELLSTQQQLLRLCIRRKSGQVDKTHQFKQLRQTVARIKTVVNQRVLGAKNGVQK